MRERPILFSGEMVRAILDGRKTQTRRVITSKAFIQWVEAGFTDEYIKNPENNWHEHCPYGLPGDLLWVRETWATGNGVGHLSPRQIEKLCRDAGYSTESCGDVWYAADNKYRQWGDKKHEQGARGLWRPSIHMPRWASRINLDIINVRVERVQEISENDAKSEGVMPAYPTALYKSAFCELWNSINSKRGFGWDANPWVWVISFKRCSS